VIAACNPIADDDTPSNEPTAIETRAPEATLPPMAIVTPTPIDPRQIPATESPSDEDVVVPSSYVVQEGDSLYSIANKFQLNLADIVALNGLSDPNDIAVGQELQLPVPEQP
jgi:LysM repeat protein